MFRLSFSWATPDEIEHAMEEVVYAASEAIDG
jgi:DNA-binding transcriptional MocR family regulator